jgi:hypothetical protein
MAQDINSPDPGAFGLTRFSDILPKRGTFVREAPGTFEAFRDLMMEDLAPATPYECVIAENLVSIEWEIVQHRRMRDAGDRSEIRRSIYEAVFKRLWTQHEAVNQASLEQFDTLGPDAVSWTAPSIFNDAEATRNADDLARRAVSFYPEERAEAEAELAELGMEPVELMAAAFRSEERVVSYHDRVLPELEVRRRGVKQEYDALQKRRVAKARVIDG